MASKWKTLNLEQRAYNTRCSNARQTALSRLAALHREEFEQIQDTVRIEMGLHALVRRRKKSDRGADSQDGVGSHS